MAGTLLVVALSAGDFRSEQRQLPPLPNKDGVAGCFVGVSNGALLVGGGANFPGKKPWEGGVKVWHDDVWVLEHSTGAWKHAGELPAPLAYGVSATHRNAVVCVGGSDSKTHHSIAFRLEWKNGRLEATSLPPLPEPMANGCGALVGEVLYVVGGQSKPDSKSASRSVWALDLYASELKWRASPPLPGCGRIFSTAASCDGSLWIIGGAELVEEKEGAVRRRYLMEVLRFSVKGGWKREADLPSPIAAAATPAPNDESGIDLLGGDDGAQVSVTPTDHRGFSRRILRFDLRSAAWIDAGRLAAPRVTVPCVWWKDCWVIPSGESRPGIRSPEVWVWSPSSKESGGR